MAVQGNLQTMSLPDLLRWAATSGETGVLELERNKVTTRIVFRDGRIVGCSSDDPPSRLGQFLLSRGKITTKNLREGLEQQKQTKEPLGQILQEMGVLTESDLQAEIAAKAEENIYGLFDWTDAVFRFHKGESDDPFLIQVDMAIEETLKNGLDRHDQLQKIREIFDSSGIVLQRTEVSTPAEIQSTGLARRLLESIDGRRTLAEMLLHAHASQFLVIKFLFTLYREGLVRISEIQAVDPNAVTLLDTRPPEVDRVDSAADSSHAEDDEEPTTVVLSQTVDTDHQDDDSRHVMERYPELSQQIDLAGQYLALGENEAALQILNDCYRSHSGDNYLKHLIERAEQAFLEEVRNGDLSSERVPARLRPDAPVQEDRLTTDESFLLNMIDGRTDIQSMLWVAPMRDVDILMALRHLLKRGVIEMLETESAEIGTVELA